MLVCLEFSEYVAIKCAAYMWQVMNPGKLPSMILTFFNTHEAFQHLSAAYFPKAFNPPPY